MAHITTLPHITDLGSLVDKLNNAFQSNSINVELVKQIMESYSGKCEEWKKYEHFDSNKLTRNLVDTGNNGYNLIFVCWEGGHQSTIHDHSGSHCIMKQLYGELNEIRYEWPNENDLPLKETSRSTLRCNGISYMNDEFGLHRMENVSGTERAVSLHLYFPPIMASKVFEKENGRFIKSRATFWSINGNKTGTM